MTLPLAYTEGLEAALAGVIAEARRDMAAERAEWRAELAECKAQLATAKAEIADLKAALMDHAGALVARAVDALPKPEAPDLSAFVPVERFAGFRDDVLAGMQVYEEQIKSLEERPVPEPIDLSGFATKDEIADVRAAIPAPVEPPDLSWVAAKDELAGLHDAVAELRQRPEPEPVDLSALATKDELAEIREAIAAPVELPDLSPFATREDVDAVRRAIPEVPPQKDWTAAIEVAAGRVTTNAGMKIEELRERMERHPGKFPVLKAWADAVHYEGDLVSHDGSIWQAQRDTGKAPPHEDWAEVVAKGRDGQDGRSFSFAGVYDPARDYGALEVVSLDGNAFVALSDDPGPCPGDRWKVMAMRGKPGRPGDKGDSIKGDPGPQGDPGPAPVALTVSDDGLLTLTMEDGQELTADLYPLLSAVAR